MLYLFATGALYGQIVLYQLSNNVKLGQLITTLKGHGPIFTNQGIIYAQYNGEKSTLARVDTTTNQAKRTNSSSTASICMS